MWRYLARRLLELLPTTAGVLLLTFLLFHVVGGSPAEVALGQHANAASLAAFDARYGYNKPLLCGYWSVSRAWSAATPLPASGRLQPAFPLAAGKWRVVVSGRESLPLRTTTPAATHGPEPDGNGSEELTITLQAPDNSAPATLSVPLKPRRWRRGWVAEWEVPPERVAVALALPAVGSDAGSLTLLQRSASLFDSQLVGYLYDLARGDLGESTAYGMRVAEVLRQGVGPSLALTVPILIGGTLLALMLAFVAAATRQRTPDHSILALSTLLMSVNYVVWVLAGQYLLAYKWRLFPIWGFEHWGYLLLPVLIGICSGLGRDIRFYRTVILDELHRPYVRTALAKGLSYPAVLRRHVLRNSLIPIVTYLSLSIPFLFAGSLLLESFFGIPGLGGVSLNAINSADMATVRAIVILGALLYQFVNLIADLCYAWLDPRVRLG